MRINDPEEFAMNGSVQDFPLDGWPYEITVHRAIRRNGSQSTGTPIPFAGPGYFDEVPASTTYVAFSGVGDRMN